MTEIKLRIFHGAASINGDNGTGTIYRLTIGGKTPKFEVVTHLPPGEQIGSNIISEPVADADGNLYFVAAGGGSNDMGSILRLKPDGQLSLAAALAKTGMGAHPIPAMTAVGDGTFLFVTNRWGDDNPGAIVQFTPGRDTLTKLHDFPAGVTTHGSMLRTRDGRFYGVADCVFRFDLAERKFTRLWPTTPLNQPGKYVFARPSDLDVDKAGTAFVIAQYEPSNSAVYRIDGSLERPTGLTPMTIRGGRGPASLVGGGEEVMVLTGRQFVVWGVAKQAATEFTPIVPPSLPSLTTLFDPSGATRLPDGSLVVAHRNGGRGEAGWLAQVRPATPIKTLAEFPGSGSLGRAPAGPPVPFGKGELLGTTAFGGARGLGVLYRLPGTGGELTVLHSFNGTTDGAMPTGTLARLADGSVFGVAKGGGAHGVGAIFRVGPDGKFSVAHSFDLARDGGCPEAGLTLGSDGKLYGTTSLGGAGTIGTIFCFDPAKSALRVLGHFPADGSLGRFPTGQLIGPIKGFVYGVAQFGGRLDGGVLYRVRCDAKP